MYRVIDNRGTFSGMLLCITSPYITLPRKKFISFLIDLKIRSNTSILILIGVWSFIIR